MSWRCLWRVHCDQCSTAGPLCRRSSDTSRRAEKAGWLVWNGFYGQFHLCPQCRNKPDECFMEYKEVKQGVMP